MSNPVLDAFFLGRALGEVLNEKLEDTLTNTLSELSKFDAEQRERLRQLMEEVLLRAKRDAEKGREDISTRTVSVGSESSEDLQEMIDELRAEIARLRAELKNYQNNA
jgi:hypothetical protein